MKKLMLVAGCLLCSFELLAGNFVPVCLNVGDDQKASVYKAIVENSFVTQLDSERAIKLSEEDKKEIINDESGFLKKKIQSVVPSAKVDFIPKSLYQLFVWNLFLDELNQKKSLEERRKFFRTGGWNRDATEYNNGIALKANSYGPGQGSCFSYMNRDAVKSYFWKINDSIVPFLDDIPTEEVYSEINLRKIMKKLLEDLPKKFESIRKVHFDGQIGDLLKFLKSEHNDIVADLIVEESKAPEDTYRIYTGENINQEIYKGRQNSRSCSFSDGMFSGIIAEPMHAMAFGYALKNNHMKIIDLPKKELLNVKVDPRGVEMSGLAVSIPPVICMGATLGHGEYFHVRTKVQDDTFEEGDIPGVQGKSGVETTPWLVTNSSQVENFWGRCKLITDKSYNIAPNSKVLNIKTYRLSSGEEKQPEPFSGCLIL